MKLAMEKKEWVPFLCSVVELRNVSYCCQQQDST